ncbi:MAG: chemotaxis protein CheC [Archaeoglobaceae archaeon]
MFDKVGNAELDVIKEIGNIGVGKAATSLSQMFGRLIEMSVPEVHLARISELHRYVEPETLVAATMTTMEDMEMGPSGIIFVAFPDGTAEKICEMLIGEASEEMVDSSAMEIGNIISSAFCDAIAEMLGISMMPSPPNFARDMLAAILQLAVAQIAGKSDYVIIFETELKDEEDMIEILVILLPNENFLSYVAEMLGMLG